MIYSKQREMILDVIRESDRHMTPEEIYRACVERGDRVSSATVYRNLGQLADAGAIQKISIKGEPDRYDRTVKPHDHLICRKCRRICDVETQGLREYLEKATGCRILSYNLSMEYICRECQSEEELQK